MKNINKAKTITLAAALIMTGTSLASDSIEDPINSNGPEKEFLINEIQNLDLSQEEIADLREYLEAVKDLSDKEITVLRNGMTDGWLD